MIINMKRILNLLFRFSNLVTLSIADIFNRKEAIIRIGRMPFSVPLPKSQGLRKALITGGYEADERVIVDRVIESGDRVLELGAAIGCLALAYASKSPETHVALDANPELIHLLEKNLNRNNVKNVVAVHGLAGVKEGKSNFYIHEDFYSSSINKPTEKTIEVDVVDVNAILSNQNINVIICDIEGGEYDLFESLSLESVDKIILEIHEIHDQEEKLLNILSNLKGSGFWFDVRNWRGNVLVFQKTMNK